MNPLDKDGMGRRKFGTTLLLLFQRERETHTEREREIIMKNKQEIKQLKIK